MLIPTCGPKSIGLGACWECLRGLGWFWARGGPVGSGFKAAQVGKDGAPLAPGELCAPPGLMGFGDSSAVSLLLGVGGLFAFGDSPPTGAFLVEELGIISRGTLHRGS
jgi:hypothetical protein